MVEEKEIDLDFKADFKPNSEKEVVIIDKDRFEELTQRLSQLKNDFEATGEALEIARNDLSDSVEEVQSLQERLDKAKEIVREALEYDMNEETYQMLYKILEMPDTELVQKIYFKDDLIYDDGNPLCPICEDTYLDIDSGWTCPRCGFRPEGER